ncbi:MAG: Uma2 family endonuclease [Spirosoma sp.]|nr:Uma2 family endonuclease [Spirosoma sp.]
MEAQSFDLIEEFHSEDITSYNHSKLIHRLSVALDRYEDQYDILPELELELSMGKCKPDVSVFPKRPEDWDNDIVFYTQPPIIAIEIQSPKQATTEITTEMNTIYFPGGVQSVWIIIPPLRLVFIQTPNGQKITYTQGTIHDPVTNITVPFDVLFR